MMTVRAGTHLGHPLEILRPEIGATAECEDVGETREFFLNMAEAVRVAHEQQHATLDAAGERDAENRFKIEAAVGEKRGDARHGAGVILHTQFEHRGGAGRLAVGRRSGRIWHGTRPALALRSWGNKNPLGAGQRGKLILVLNQDPPGVPSHAATTTTETWTEATTDLTAERIMERAGSKRARADASRRGLGAAAALSSLGAPAARRPD